MLSAVFRQYCARQAAALKDSSLRPARAQSRTLTRLLAENRGSRLARELGFDRVRHAEDMRGLPATDYAVLRSHFEKALKQGAEGAPLFGRSRLLAFKKTSGTSGEPKYIPVNAAYLASYRRSTLRAASACFQTSGTLGQLPAGKILLLSSRARLGETHDGLPIGSSTGLMALLRPAISRTLCAPSRETLLLEDWKDRLDRTLEEARDQPIRMIAGMPRLVASLIERARERYGIETLSELWPGLGKIAFGGVPLSEAARQSFIRDVGASSPLVFHETYAASEGLIGCSFDAAWPGLVFNSLENFYQFKTAPAQAGFLQLHELEAGRRYLVYLTTPGGLINYGIGDWIEVLSARPLTFRVCGRLGDELSLAGERVTSEQVVLALRRSLPSGSATSEDFVVWGEEEPRRLVFGVTAPEVGLAAKLDQALGELNSTYRLMRSGEGTLGFPEVRRIPKPAFDQYFKRNLDRSQFKGRRLFRCEADFRTEFTYQEELA